MQDRYTSAQDSAILLTKLETLGTEQELEMAMHEVQLPCGYGRTVAC